MPALLSVSRSPPFSANALVAPIGIGKPGQDGIIKFLLEYERRVSVKMDFLDDLMDILTEILASHSGPA